MSSIWYCWCYIDSQSTITILLSVFFLQAISLFSLRESREGVLLRRDLSLCESPITSFGLWLYCQAPERPGWAPHEFSAHTLESSDSEIMCSDICLNISLVSKQYEVTIYVDTQRAEMNRNLLDHLSAHAKQSLVEDQRSTKLRILLVCFRGRSSSVQSLDPGSEGWLVDHLRDLGDGDWLMETELGGGLV